MASDSIAKLAVIITGDESPLVAALNRGAAASQRFQAEAEAGATRSVFHAQLGIPTSVLGLWDKQVSLIQTAAVAQDGFAIKTRASAAALNGVRNDQLAAGMVNAGRGMQAFNAASAVANGNLTKLVSLAGTLGGPAGGILLAAAAVGVLSTKLAAVSDAQRVAAGASPADTWAGQWDRVQTQVSRVAVILGRPIADIFLRETKQVADVLEMIVRSTMPAWVKQEEAAIALAKQKNELAKKAADLKREEAKAAELALQKAKEIAAFEHQRGMDALGRARAIADSLRTPREELVATIAEMSALVNAGALSVAMYQRGIAKAKDDFEEASKLKRKFEAPAAEQGVGAAERFTSAGASAVAAGQRELRRQVQLQEKLLDAAREEARLTRETNELIRRFSPITFTRSRL